MRYISLKDAQPGMALAYNIYDDYGHTLVGSKTPLTETLITRLEEHGFNGIYITDELSEDIEIVAAIPAVLRQDALHAIRNQDIDACVVIAQKIVDQLTRTNPLSLDLTDLRSFDDMTYAHSVNVAVSCCVIGIGMDMNQTDLSRLVTAALLHDLGKLAIPPEILNKPSRLTAEEYQLIKSHPLISYQLIKDRANVSAHVKAAVLAHHENVDGSGYPNGTTGNEQSIFAKILHVADVYDALVSKRSYKEPYSPYEASEYLMGGCGIMFDKDIVEKFVNYIPLYPKGTEVLLSDGRRGIIFENAGIHNLRPIVRLMDKSMIDLSEVQNLSIGISVPSDADKPSLFEAEKERAKMLTVQKKPHLLAVDDLKTNLQLLRDILEDKYELTLVRSGKKAIEYMEKDNDIELILMDIDMPDMNGLETAERINRITGGDIPIIYVTALADAQTVLACRRLNAAAYVLRPYNPTYIKAEIHRILFGRGENE